MDIHSNISAGTILEVGHNRIHPLWHRNAIPLFYGDFRSRQTVLHQCDTPLHKKDEETLFTNYRQISLLPALSEIFEKVIFKQLYTYFQENSYCTMHKMDSKLSTLQNLLL